MHALENDVRTEIEDLHRFFVEWFTGRAELSALNTVLLSALDEKLLFVSPDGRRLGRDALGEGFRAGHGTNPDFRIAIRDVKIQHDLGKHVLATYTEWQKGARMSAQSENARMASVLMTRDRPFRWLSVHETWLPAEMHAADAFDF